jgi:tetratricopeptide (TPR) repeat protein
MKGLGKYFCLALTSFGLALVLSSQSLAKVKAWEGTIVIPTYGWAEDINPKLWALEGDVKFSTTVKGSIVYPYPMQDHLSRNKKDRNYKALFLENEYLKVTCLPELGGRLHSVLDKTENKEMFHLNHVIKPGMIAMRGAWISGGVEWNAGPQGHTVTVLSPVDALVGENSDGSAYLEVNNLEKTQRTRWTVRVTLHPGKAYLDERIRLFNPEDAVSPYYFWNCTAFPNRPGTRFIYPMTLGTDHNGVKFFNWPIDDGRDMTWLKNYEIYSSVFAVNCVYDFFGAYDVDADRGIVQTADHRRLGGKKAWTWGTWDFGLVSQQNLTDNDGPYIEVQSGPLPTQSDYGMLVPRQEVSWQEYWYPVHGLGDGFEYATKDIAVQTARENDTLKLNIIATGRFPGATCLITRDGRQLLKKTLDLGPENPKIVTLPQAAQSPVEVTITSGKQQVLALFVTPLPIPKTPEPKPSDLMRKPDEQLTLQEKFLKGRKFDLATNRRRAREYYEKALAEDEQYSPALRSLAVLDIEAGLYEKATGRLKAAVKRDDNDGLAWYFLGVGNLRLGNNNEALRCAYKAMRCLGTDSLGCDLAGRTFMRQGEHSKAVQIFRRAVRLNPDDCKAKDHLILALYAAGRKKQSFKQAEAIITKNPTALIPRMVLAFRNKNQMNQFVRDAQAFVGEDEFEMLEAGLVFKEMTLIKEAAELLKAACVDAVPEDRRSPTPLYYLAYFASLQNDQPGAEAYLEQAARLNRDFVFPSRPEEIAVLEYAVENNPGDAHAHLYLGDLYSHLDRQEDAVRQWSKAVELDSTLSVAFRNLGLYAWSAEEDLPKAEGFYRKAIAARPDDQTLYRDLADILLADKRRPDAIKVLETMPYEKIRRADIIIMLAQMYLDEKQYTDVINLLESTPYFVNWEGQTITWDIFHKAHLERGRQRFEKADYAGALHDFEASLTYPENIGVGRSNRPQEASSQFWRGKALQALGHLDEARLAWKEGAAGHEGSREQNENIELCTKALSM